MLQLFKRQIGQILLDGKFLSRPALKRALDEQKRTHELLGEVLVRMGVLKAHDINPPLAIQGHLSHIEDAVKLAAGQRQLLGALLVQSRHISSKQLDHAIAEQKRTGEKLGEVFARLGLLTQSQLKALLSLQQNQAVPSASPLRLGELLIATGYISREQLEQALQKQTKSGKKLGEVLVEEGYARSSQIKHGMRLQKMLLNSVLATILSVGIGTTSFASTVSLQWNPDTSSSVVGYKVYYEADSSSVPFQGPAPIDVQAQTSATISNLDPSHAYSFAVTAYDASGVESSYSNIVSVPELVPPITSISYPANASTVSGTVSVTADASDNVGVTKVEFYVNGVLQASDTASPYLFSWNTAALPPGNYTLMTKAYDAAGNVGQSANTTVAVANDTIAPTVSLTSPVNSATVSGTVTISANASDNVGVTRVEFYENGALLYAANVSPFNYNWDTTTVANGGYTLSAKAYDAAGNVAQATNVSVTVSNVILDTSAPTVTGFTMPTTAKTRTVAISSFTASDNVGVTGYLITESATTPLATASSWSATAPTSYTFSSTGTKTAYAWAKDAAGNVSASKSDTVKIR